MTLIKDVRWHDIECALQLPEPRKYFNALAACGKLPIYVELSECSQHEIYHPEGNVRIHTNMVMQCAADANKNSLVMFACLTHDFGKPKAMKECGNTHKHDMIGIGVIDKFCDEVGAPPEYRVMAKLSSKFHSRIHNLFPMGKNRAARPRTVCNLLDDLCASSYPQRLINILDVCECDAMGRGVTPDGVDLSKVPYLQKPYLLECFKVYDAIPHSVSFDWIINKQKRVEAITKVFVKWHMSV